MDKLEHEGWKCSALTDGGGAPRSEGLNGAAQSPEPTVSVLTASQRLGTPNLAGGGRLLLLLHPSHPWRRSRPPGAPGPAGTAAARPRRDISQKLRLSHGPAAALLQPHLWSSSCRCLGIFLSLLFIKE